MNVGEWLVRSALVAALAAVVLGWGALRGRSGRASAWAFALHAALIVASLTLLGLHFLGRRFEYVYVAQYSSRALSPALTLAAVWAGQEGSILLWAALGALLGLALLRQPGALARPALFFVSLAQVALLALLAVKSPFATTPLAPHDGQGLNPLLEDPWMVIHPPVLFLGYAALLIPYALAAAALVRGEYREWNRMTWPWALFGVVTLGAGIALGGVWAYKVLGWGGYWGWDPVENASLVPWLVAVALLHGLLIQRTTGALARTNLALAFGGWAAVLGGTYLTRSGVLQDFSVHSFADSGLKTPLTATLVLFTLLGVALLAARWRRVEAGAVAIGSLSRESALWLGMVTVLALGTLVALGTSAPLLTSLAGKPAGVQPAFFASVSLPIGIALVLLMGASPALRWFHQNGISWLHGLAPGLAGALIVTVPAVMAGAHDPGFVALIAVAGLALGVNLAVALRHFRRGWMYGAGYLGHAGLAVMVLGMALSGSLGKSERLQLTPGHTVQSLGYALTFEGDESAAHGGRVLRIAVVAPHWKLDARPELLPAARDMGVVRKPAISGARELYLSPVEFRAAEPGSADVTWLEKGTPVEVGGARYTFTGFRMEHGAEFMAYADLEVAKQGRTYKVSPAISAGPSGNRAVPADVPSVGSISLARMDADRGRVAISLPNAGVAAGVAVVDLSTKPFINLVWIGVLLAFLGTALAGIRRAAETQPRRDRPVAARTQPKPLRTETPMGKESVMLSASSSPSGRGGNGVLALLLVLGALFACVPAARAADKSAAPPDTSKPVMFLKETVVTGTRYPRAYYESPQALSFVTRTQLRQQQPTVVGDVLYGVPGVDNSKDSPWEQRPVVRGLSGQRVLVMMDGSPMNSARGNGPHPSLVDQSQVERIEVVRGPSSVAYGSDALGGVINIITRQAPTSNNSRTLPGSATVGGSTADQQFNGYVEMRPTLGRLSAFVSAGGRNTQDFKTPDNGKVLNSSFSDYNAMANLRYGLSDRTALKAGWQLYRGHDIGIPGLTVAVPGFSQDFRFPYYDRNAVHLAAEHTHPASSWFSTSSVKAYWQSEDRDFYSNMNIDFTGTPGFPPGTVIFKQNTDRYFKLDTYGLRAQADSRKFEAYSLSFGVDAARDKTDGTNVAVQRLEDGSGGALAPPYSPVSQSLPKGNFDNLAGFAQSEVYLHPQWTLSAGARYTYYHYRTEFGVAQPAYPGGAYGPPSAEETFQPYSVDNGALAGSLGLVYAAQPDLHLSANIANGYRQPNAQDLFFNGPASVGTVLGNPNLKPEKSLSSDLGMRWGPGNLGLSGNLFYSTYDDLIDAVQFKSGQFGAPNTYQYVNITQARIWGGEAEAEWRFHKQWAARANCTGTVGDITSREAIEKLYGVSADTAPLPNVPPFKGNASLRWTTSNGRGWVEPAMRYSWRTNRLPYPTPGVGQLSNFTKEWMVGDVTAGMRLGQGQRITVGVRNFTNTPYQLPLGSLEEPGVSFVGSITADF